VANKKPLSTQQDGYLRERDKQGDVEAWSILFHRQALHLMATGKGPPSLLVRLDKDIWLNFRKAANRVAMFLEIREHTTPKKIKDKWPEIANWRRLLADWQGPWTGGGDGYLFARLAAQEEDFRRFYPRKVHSELAKQLNQTLERYLKEFAKDQGHGYAHALSLLRTMQPRGKDHEAWIIDALESIQRGQPPTWTTGAHAYTRPITGQNVRDRLKTWTTKYPPRTTRNK
jgi:hypothetical protein